VAELRGGHDPDLAVSADPPALSSQCRSSPADLEETDMTVLRIRSAAAGLCAAALTSGAAAAVLAEPASAAAVPRCGNASLAVTRTFVQGGAGHSWMALVYRNATNRTCTVRGYPGLDAITRSGHVLAHAVRTSSGYGGAGHLTTVTIVPGGYASASVEWLNFNGHTGGACRFSAAVNTIVANTGRVHRLPVSVSVCGLQVHPTVHGTPGYPDFGPAQRWWIRGSSAIAADQNYYFGKARLQLQAAHVYPTQVAQLAQLASFPDTGLTAAQIATVRADVKALNAFFGTPGLYL
jgi:hypothetical protein